MKRLLLALLLAPGCTAEPADSDPADSDPADSGPADSGGSDPAPFVLDDIVWEACDLYSEGGGPAAECATVRTPLRYDEPEGETIDVFVKRFRPEGGTGANALWMLQSGPGASGRVFEGLSEILATRFPDVDYYFPDHRGTGRSTRLTCVSEEETSPDGRYIGTEEWDACQADAVARYGSDLEAFSSTNAANDVGILVDAVEREAGQPQVVFGVSYGTYWAHRYLQLYPEQAAGVILDSMAAPGMSLYRQDDDANFAAEAFFNACGADEFCAGKPGSDPWAVADGLVAKLKAGHCNEADIEALNVLMGVLTQEQPESLEYELWGYVLTQNVIRSEFGESPMPTEAELEAIRDGAVAFARHHGDAGRNDGLAGVPERSVCGGVGGDPHADAHAPRGARSRHARGEGHALPRPLHR